MPSGSVNAAQEQRWWRPGLSGLAVLACLGAGVLIALVMYEPWRSTQFSITDFSEFLPVLEQHRTVGGRLGALVGYYASQGRFNVVPYIYLVLEWTAFGWNAAAWQMCRFIEMCGIVVLVYALLHRLVGSRPGAIAGAGLFVVASCAAPAWIRLTMAEPLAMWLLLGGALLATNYQTTALWRWSGVVIGILMGLVVLTKEVLVVLVPFIVLLACTRDDHGQFIRPSPSPRNRWLTLSTLIATTLSLVPVAAIALRARGTAFAAQYGQASPSMSTAIERFMALFLPAFATYAPHVGFMVLANFIFVVLIATGWIVRIGDQRWRRSSLLLGTCLLAVSLTSVAVYLPWPFFNFFYGLPFLLGPSALLAFAFHFVEGKWPRWRWIIYAAYALALTQMASFAVYSARSAIARRDVNGKLISRLGQLSEKDSVLLGTHASRVLTWAGTGPTLSRFASAIYPERAVPAIREVPCDHADAIAHGYNPNRVTVLSYSDDCGVLIHPSWSARNIYTFLYWPTVSLSHDSVRVDMRLP